MPAWNYHGFALHQSTPHDNEESLDCSGTYLQDNKILTPSKRIGVQYHLQDMRNNVRACSETRLQVLDVRSSGRFEGTEPEPRVSMSS